MKKVHFISIGGSVMHSLAIELKRRGFDVTGSDDAIYEPSKSSLLDNNLLPKKLGWCEKNIKDSSTEEATGLITGAIDRV